jgi:hypothetical protein
VQPVLPEMGVANRLDELEWDFIQARAESPDFDSLGWTHRESSCLDAILEHKREGIKASAAVGTGFPTTGTQRIHRQKDLPKCCSEGVGCKDPLPS